MPFPATTNQPPLPVQPSIGGPQQSTTEIGGQLVPATTLANLASRRAANIAAFQQGPAVIAPLWVTVTPYVLGNVVTITGGQHLVCTASGTSGASMPVYTSAVLTGRPFTDGSVTWYGLPFVKAASDVTAPVVTSGANAAALGLVFTGFNVAGAINAAVTPYSAKQINFANSLIRHYQFAVGNSLAAGNATGNATQDGLSAAFAYNVQTWDMEFYVTDSKFGVQLGPAAGFIYIEIDGQIMSGNPVALASGGCVAFDYSGVVKRRLVRVADVQVGASVNGVAMTAQGILEPSDSPNDCILLLGDSLMNTVVPGILTPMAAMQGFWLKRLLGVSSMVNATVGGSGYVSAISNSFNVESMLSAQPNQQLFAGYAPGHIHISAGYNDSGLPFSQVGPAALRAWTAARAQFPNAKITVTDGFAEAKGPDAATLAQAANLLALFNTWNDPNSKFVQAVGPSVNTSWTQGTGNAGSGLAAGNASNFVSTDTVHPTPAGAYYLATRMANAVKNAWNNAY